MVQEKLQQAQIRATELAAQREIVAKPRVQVFDQGTASGCLRHGLRQGVEDGMEFSAHPGAQPVPSLPVSRRCARLAVQQARCAHEMLWQLMGLRDGVQFVVEHVGEREQVVALVLQHRADAARIIDLAPFHLTQSSSGHESSRMNSSACGHSP